MALRSNSISTITLILLISFNSLLAQKSVTGFVISSSDSEPLVGVTVLVKGTQNGTVTDLDGAFSLNLSEGQDLVVASFVGIKVKKLM